MDKTVQFGNFYYIYGETFVVFGQQRCPEKKLKVILIFLCMIDFPEVLILTADVQPAICLSGT